MPVVRTHMSRDLLSVEPGETITQVAQRMVERNVGAVLVLDGGRPVGIMTGRFRHLPVVEGDEVVGMLSIRDLMRVALEDSAPRGV